MTDEELTRRFDSLAELSRANSERTDAQIQELRDRVESVETTLLTEFHKWASPTEA